MNTVAKIKEADKSADNALQERKNTIIAEHEGWKLIERHSSNGWIALKLERRSGKGFIRHSKRSWWFGWNGERLSRTHDLQLLAEHHPDIEAWVVEQLCGRA